MPKLLRLKPEDMEDPERLLRELFWYVRSVEMEAMSLFDDDVTHFLKLFYHNCQELLRLHGNRKREDLEVGEAELREKRIKYEFACDRIFIILERQLWILWSYAPIY
jgi:hypothetical protein